MVERIFAEQTLTACFIEGDQTRDYFARRHGLRKCDRLLVDNVACPGLNGNVRQPALLDAALIMHKSTRFSDQGGVTNVEPSVLADLCARYSLEMKPESVPELIQRFQLRFPGEPVVLSAVG